MIVDACTNPYILGVIYFIKELLKIVGFIVPIGLILMVSFDFFKNVIAGNTDEMKKNLSLAIKRIICAVGLFLVFPIVNFAMGLVADTDSEALNWTACYNNATISDIAIYQAVYDEVKDEIKAVKTPTTNLSPPSSGLVVAPGNNKDYFREDPDQEFLTVAKSIWKKIINGNFTYRAKHNGRTYYNKIPINNSYCDCSSYVSWVLYEYGVDLDKLLEDLNVGESRMGKQLKTWDFKKIDWEEKFGWKEISVKEGQNVSKIVKAGDILVRTGHIDIIASVKNGKILAYDCGNTDFVQSGSLNGVDASWFTNGSGNKAGKIIRVK